jgi:hypothetical protein
MALEGFWSDFSVEPKRKFRWLLSFRGIPQWILKKVTKPAISITEAEHTFVNYKFYYPGRVEWNEITMTLADPVNPDASATMMKLLKDSGYVSPHNFLTDERSLGNVLTISKQRAVEAVGGAIYIQQIDADGMALEEWKLYNPWIKSISFDELDYESEDINNLEVTFRYDWAALTDVGGAPGRVDITADKTFDLRGNRNE